MKTFAYYHIDGLTINPPYLQICGSVKFIPDRPRELVSGGYDTYLLHFDIVKGRVLTRRQMG